MKTAEPSLYELREHRSAASTPAKQWKGFGVAWPERNTCGDDLCDENGKQHLACSRNSNEHPMLPAAQILVLNH